ncbi:hypothetical protein GQ55_3G082700 [Panicum hallii var. hallii]|uniref:Uncharacterized protein n=1 Tax=Panicum hallii var. hallii TaxID=1504633 RepID=A0A2T7E718_9POAL|nr:hypothetical protein GQ55_3G082700 [Panicum hallii var. hallii]
MVLVDGTRSAGSPTAPSPLVGAASTPAPATLLPVPFPVLLPDHRRGTKPGNQLSQNCQGKISLMATVRDKLSGKVLLDGKLLLFP